MSLECWRGCGETGLRRLWWAALIVNWWAALIGAHLWFIWPRAGHTLVGGRRPWWRWMQKHEYLDVSRFDWIRYLKKILEYLMFVIFSPQAFLAEFSPHKKGANQNVLTFHSNVQFSPKCTFVHKMYNLCIQYEFVSNLESKWQIWGRGSQIWGAWSQIWGKVNKNEGRGQQ